MVMVSILGAGEFGSCIGRLLSKKSGMIMASIMFMIFTARPVSADTGSEGLPDRNSECLAGIEKIECTSWYEKPDACDQWLNDPEYIVAEGSRGASVQHYTFCKRDPAKPTREEKGAAAVIVGAVVALAVAGFSLVRLLMLRKKRG